VDVLGVVERSVPNAPLGDRSGSQVKFLDWTVNGVLLRSMLGWADPPLMTTCLRAGWVLGPVLASLASLTAAGRGEFPDGRAAILVCEQCGDLECGAVSARIEIGDGVVHWTDFGWQVPSEDGFDPLETPLRLTFSEREYQGLLAGVRDRLLSTATPSWLLRPLRPWLKPRSMYVAI
jgi:hypothetical protein